MHRSLRLENIFRYNMGNIVRLPINNQGTLVVVYKLPHIIIISKYN